jgi:hypothetical protein
MRRTRSPLLLLSIGVAACGAAIGASVIIGCEDEHRRSSGGEIVSGCSVKPGQVPPPNCDNASGDCTPQEGCTINEAKCGSKSTCLPLADNKGKSLLDFRMRRLNVAAPKALSQAFIQKTVVTTNIDLAARDCAEKGKGLFTWLLRVDRQKNLLVTGGAPPPVDPFNQGFCFANFLSPDAIRIEPLQTAIAFEGDTFKSTEKKKLNVPIFLNADPKSVIVLPVTDVVIQGVTISEGGNCIGKLNTAAIDSECGDDPQTCSKWLTAGALGGYITLEEADHVFIQDLQQSLCVVLTQSVKAADNHCTKTADGKIAYEGDYCSKDKQAGSCKDSFWLAATFAASAAKIFDGKNVDACSGGGPVDGGTDGAVEGGSDGGSDAGSDASDAAPE